MKNMTKEKFVKDMETKIISGELEFGYKLPPERVLAKQLNISRTSVNAGLSELEKKGFVKMISRKGNFVNDYSKEGNLETLLSIIHCDPSKLSESSFLSLMDFRLKNEGNAGYLAALNRTQQDIDTLNALKEQIYGETECSVVSKLLYDFHRTIFTSTGNVFYSLVFNAFKSIIIAFAAVLTPEVLENSRVHFDKLIEAITNKNPDIAKTEIVALTTLHGYALKEKLYSAE